MIMSLAGLLLALASAGEKPSVPYADLHLHIAAHLAMPLAYGPGPLRAPPVKKPLRWDDMWRQQMYPKFLRDSGAQLVVSGAYVLGHDIKSGHARKKIRQQLDFMKAYAKKHSDWFEIAFTPTQARKIIASGRTAIVLALEGAAGALYDEFDARELAAQGVAMVTLIHLSDGEYGASSLVSGIPGWWLNPWGKLTNGLGFERPGLSKRGAEAVRWLGDAGIMVDLNHMSSGAIQETLKLTRRLKIPPVFTHGYLAELVAHENAISADQLVDVY
ncbi:MAG: membrane dipeptidase, partial [Bdellovibrionota bacterium]